MIIISVGYPGAGKSELADFIEKQGIKRISMGDILRNKFEEARQDGLVEKQVDKSEEKSRSTLLGDWASKQREIHGDDVVAQWTTGYIKENISSDIVLIDGLRSPAELSTVKDNFDDVKLVYVSASKSTRLERLKNRGREGEDSFTIEDLNTRDKREEMWGLDKMKRYANYDIENETSIDDFHRNIENILRDLISSDE